MTTRQHLIQLESTGLIRLAQTQPELEYLFRHTLVLDVAYESLLLADRKRLHLRVAEALERLYPDRLTELAAVLGHHFDLADDVERAFKYFIRAGDTAALAYASDEAVEHYSRALEIANQVEITSDQLSHLYIQRGRALELSAQYQQAVANYEAMEAVAQERTNQAMALTAMIARSTLFVTYTSVHNPNRGEALLKEALVLAGKLNDQAAEAKLLWNLSNLNLFSGRSTAQAVDYGERSLALARRLNLREQMAYCLNDLALGYWMDCDIEQSKRSLREASGLWRELENLPMLADSLSTSSGVWFSAGEYDQAIAFSDEAYQIGQSVNNLWGQSYSRHWIGRVYWECGQPGRAIAAMEESISLGELAGFTSPLVGVRADQAFVLGHLGQIERGLEIARLALAVAEKQLPLDRALVLVMLANLHLLNGDLAEAETALEQAGKDPNRQDALLFRQYDILVESELGLKRGYYRRVLAATERMVTDLRQFNFQALIPHALFLQGKALLGLRQVEGVHERLLEARTEAEALGSRWMLWQILALLAKIETDPTEAEALHRQACDIIEYIANHTPTELRQSFLNLPDVRAVIDK